MVENGTNRVGCVYWDTYCCVEARWEMTRVGGRIHAERKETVTDEVKKKKVLCWMGRLPT